MKTLSKIFAVAILLAAVALGGGWTTSNAKVSTINGGPGAVIAFYGNIDSTETHNSSAFTLASYDGESFYSYPIAYAYKLTSASGTPRVSLFIQYSFDQSNWANADTIVYIDSIETLQKGVLNLNDVKAPYYRVVGRGESNNRLDLICDLKLYAYRKD